VSVWVKLPISRPKASLYDRFLSIFEGGLGNFCYPEVSWGRETLQPRFAFLFLDDDTAMRVLDEQEKAIVRQLIRDPRESDNGIGEKSGVNVRTVSRKRQRLEQEGVLSYFTHLDLSQAGAQQFNARHLYIIKFRVGITYRQLVEEIRQEPKKTTVFTERIFESHIAEIDGKVALLLFVDGHNDVDIVQRTQEDHIHNHIRNNCAHCI
jgi:DNA-binding Lrp family transcriptional regulator